MKLERALEALRERVSSDSINVRDGYLPNHKFGCDSCTFRAPLIDSRDAHVVSGAHRSGAAIWRQNRPCAVSKSFLTHCRAQDVERIVNDELSRLKSLGWNEDEAIEARRDAFALWDIAMNVADGDTQPERGHSARGQWRRRRQRRL